MNSEFSLQDAHLWACEEFGQAALGDLRRNHRLVQMAAMTADHPRGKITQVFQTDAERQGAYGFLEDPRISASVIAQQTHSSCAHRCQGEGFVFVPADKTALVINDELNRKGTGPLSSSASKTRGFEVVSAIAVRSDGTPLGLCGQVLWARGPKRVSQTRKQRPLAKKETRFFFEVIEQSDQAFHLSGGACRPWYQIDGEGDIGTLLWEAVRDERLLTIRASQDRRVTDGQGVLLWPALQGQPPRGWYDLDVQAGPNRKARRAAMSLRFRPVEMDLYDRNDQKHHVVLWALLVQEEGTTPPGEEPLQWLLLTTYPIVDVQDACLVVYGYSQRWRVEDFHRAWKNGACHIEDTELESPSAIFKWAILMAAVAMRILRLTYLARTEPNSPATQELQQREVDALIGLRQPSEYQLGQVPPIGVAVRWLADLGGYTGKSSGGPPGPTVIARGLQQVRTAVQLLINLGIGRSD